MQYWHRLKLLPILFLAVVSLAQSPKPEWCQKLPRPQWSRFPLVKPAESWFEVHLVRNGVYAIYEPHQSEETISWLILGSKRAVLLDTGMGIDDLQHTIEELTDLPITVLNTHTHNDHVGSNWQFDDVRNFDLPFTHENSSGSREDAQAEIAHGEICGNLPAGFDAPHYETKPWRISAYIHDNDLIDLGGRMLRIIATPGHTPDALSLFDEANGLLWTGDTFYPGPIWLFRPETDFVAYEHSLQRLSMLAPKVKLLLGAHNAPGPDGSELPRVLAAFQQVRAHQVKGTPRQDGKIEYVFPTFSFLMKQQPLR